MILLRYLHGPRLSDTMHDACAIRSVDSLDQSDDKRMQRAGTCVRAARRLHGAFCLGAENIVFATHVVHLVIETAGVTHGVAIVIASPQRRHVRLTVGARCTCSTSCRLQ